MRNRRLLRERALNFSRRRRIAHGAHHDKTGAMRILYSHRTRSADGQFVHIRELTDALKRRGHEIVMAGPGADEKPLNAQTSGALRRLPPAIYECAEFAYSFPAYRRLATLAARAAPDILYERYNLFFHAGAWLKKRRAMPMMLEVNAPLAGERVAHGRLFWKAFARRSEASIWRAADAALAVSAVVGEHLLAAGLAEDKIHIIHNGACGDFLRERNGDAVRARYGLEGKIVLGFAGFLRDWHGAHRAVNFMAEQNRSDLHLLFVGDGPAREGLDKLATARGVEERITITGVVQRDAAPDYMAAFDIALQPAATAYASPLKLFEYMALAKPILAPSQANIREILAHGEDSFLFDAEAPDAFDKALLELIDNAELRRRLGAGARATLERRDFTCDANARRVETIAENLLRKRR